MQISSEKFHIPEGAELDMILNVKISSCNKISVIIVRFSWDFTFLLRFLKNNQISNIKKYRPMEDELFLADGQSDMAKLIVDFRNFANAPKNTYSLPK